MLGLSDFLSEMLGLYGDNLAGNEEVHFARGIMELMVLWTEALTELSTDLMEVHQVAARRLYTLEAQHVPFVAQPAAVGPLRDGRRLCARRVPDLDQLLSALRRRRRRGRVYPQRKGAAAAL